MRNKIFLAVITMIIGFSVQSNAFAEPSSLASGYLKTAIAYPTGRKSTSSLLLEKHYPQRGIVGDAYEYMIKVTNLTALDLENVTVTEEIPEDFELIKADPKSDSRVGSKAKWNLGSLSANDSVLITIKGKAKNKQSLPCCTSADYAFPTLCHNPAFIQPEIRVSVDVKKSNLVCDEIPVEYTVKNTGDSVLNDVVLKGELPEGVVASNGSGRIMLEVGSLKAGESKSFNQLVKARDTGTYQFGASVTSDYVKDNATAKSAKVIKPNVVVVAKVSKENQFIGRNVDFIFEVKNPSGVKAESTILEAKLPANTKFKSATADGKVTGESVRWNIGTLDAYESTVVRMTIASLGSGRVESEARVKATCTDIDSDMVAANFSGIPALLLEVVDLVDPIEIGEEETYVIRVTNQGTANANNVKIAAKFDGMKYVNNTGATKGEVTGNSVNFRPLSSLAPKESVEWKVNLSGQRAGDLRFRVNLTSDELTSPVEESESTFVY